MCRLLDGATCRQGGIATYRRVGLSIPLVSIQLAGTNVDGSAVLDDVRPFFTEMLERIHGRTQRDDLLAWLEEREGSFSQIRARGTWLQSHAQGPNARWLSILPEMPA